jgi:hypothetical protein
VTIGERKMITALRTVFRIWTPWEEAVTSAVIERLGAKAQDIVRKQLAAVNKVRRIVGWREIDLYVMKNRRVDRSGLPTLFDDREFVLARVVTKVGDRRVRTTVNCVGGYLFSLESDGEVRPIAFRSDIEVEVLEVDRRFV